jgi:predicted nucleotidyltransferase
MRLRETAWRRLGPAVGRLAPAPSRKYYETITASLVRLLAATPGVRAVYAYGSYALGDLVPGQSDVDLLAVVDDLPPEAEVDLLLELRRRYRRREGLLPIDLSVLPQADFRFGAGWLGFARMRIGGQGLVCPLDRWLLLAGEEQRGTAWEPDPSLQYLTEGHVLTALDAWAGRGDRAGRVAERLGWLDRDASAEGLKWPPALELHDARARLGRPGAGPADAVAGIHAALSLIDEHRARHAVRIEHRAPTAEGWLAETPSAEARASARRLVDGLGRASPFRSATLYVPPFEPDPVLLLEASGLEDARRGLRAAIDGLAEEAARSGIRVQVLTSRLAEDSWRSGLRVVPLVAAATHLAGEPLAPRLGFPAVALQRELALGRALNVLATMRWHLLGLRRWRVRDDAVPLRLAVCRALLTGAPPVTESGELVRRTPELAELRADGLSSLDARGLTELCLRLWRSFPETRLEPRKETSSEALTAEGAAPPV